MLWTNNTTEARVSLREESSIPHIDLAELPEQARIRSRRDLITLIERRQKRFVEDLCGPRYSRGHSYRIGSSYTKTLVTGLGEIQFKDVKIIRRSGGQTNIPILEALDVNRRRYFRSVRMKLAGFASKMSYGDACLEFETATGVNVPKRTVHSFVGEIAPRLLEAGKIAAKAEIIIGDSTKVRAQASQEMNNVRVLISGGGRLLSLKVNEEWPRAETDVLVSDGEPGLVNAVEAKSRQLCVVYALKYLLFTLRREGMSPVERHEAGEAVRHAVFPSSTLLRSILRREDGEKLRARIDEALRELREIACKLRRRGYPKAAGFLERNAKFIVTFAKVALEGMRIPYTTNRIERLMGEVSKRCKHKETV